MKTARRLTATEDVDDLLAASADRPALIFKHSTTCPVSARAHEAWEAFLRTPDAERVTPAWVRVIEERPVSLALSERVGVPHASPQALLVSGGRVLWHDSHQRLTLQALRSAVSVAVGASGRGAHG